MQLLAKFKQILYMGFSATLNFRKNSLPVSVVLGLRTAEVFCHTLVAECIF